MAGGTLRDSDSTDVRMEAVSYRYPGAKRQALADVNLEIKQGEIVLVTGPSGSGKTTLASTLNGIVPQSYGGEFSGRITVRGHDNVKTPIGRLAFVAGMLFQDPSSQLLLPTVEDEVAFGPENKCLPIGEVERLIEQCLTYAGLQQYRKRNPHALSGGQQQTVAIAAVLAMEPDIYVLDEPTSDLDPMGSQRVFELFEKIVRDENKTAVIVEHKIEKLLEIVDRIVVMSNGRIVASDAPRKVLSDYRMLLNAGVHAPQVTQLIDRLKQAGYLQPGDTAFTVPEAAGLLRPLLQKTGNSRVTHAYGDRHGVREAGEPVVEVSDVHFAYPDGTVALRGVDLQIRVGEFVSIVGQNGSGKTTLVKHLNGLLRPSSGTIRIKGENIAGLPVSVVSSRAGYCFQNPDHQIFSSRVYDELAFGPRNLKKPESEIKETVHMVAARLGLEDLLDENPHNLSKGQRQRIAVASVLAMGPDVIIVDEPTTGQDPRQSRDMMDLVKTLNREHGKTIVAITHDMALAAEYSDRLVVMHSGTKILDGEPREVFSQKEVLRSTNLEAPQVIELFQALGIEPLPLTVDEAFETLTKAMEGSR